MIVFASLGIGAVTPLLQPQLLAMPAAASNYPTVAPHAETDTIHGSPDSADDIAIWVHPTDYSRSMVIGTDKGNGIATYDLDGAQLQFLSVGGTNNVDLRYDIPLAGQSADILSATNTRSNTLRFYRIDPQTRQLTDVSARSITPSIKVYGLCMYHSAISGKYYAFITKHYSAAPTGRGEVQQWELIPTTGGKLDATLVRTLTNVGSSAEGCVADDAQAALYVADGSGVWQFGAEPSTGSTSTRIVPVGGMISTSIEGVTLYIAGPTTGYIIFSDQGNSIYHVYKREGNHAYVGTFQIGASSTIDGVSDTDGVDVINMNLGSAFPQGMFVAQDNPNTIGTSGLIDRTNFKLVRWNDIAQAISPHLTVDTSWNPRSNSPPSTPTSTGVAGSPTASPMSTSTATPTTQPTIPPVALPGRIEAENYRAGGEGVGYHDTTAGNSGAAYRADDVDIGPCSDGTSCYTIGWTVAGEWLNYDVSIATAGSYTLQARVATKYSGTKLHVELDGQNVSGTIIAPNTGDWQTWATVQSAPINLPAGQHTLRLVWDAANLNVNYLDVIAAPSTAHAVPGIIEAEAYNAGGEGVGYHDTTAGNTGGAFRTDDVDIQSCSDGAGCFNVGWTTAGEWLNYDINVTTSGSYTAKLRVASPYSGQRVRLDLDGAAATGWLTVPNTGGWQTWTTVQSAPFVLGAGTHTLRLTFEAGSMNVNYLDIRADTQSPTSTATPTNTAAPTNTATSTVVSTNTPTNTPTSTSAAVPTNTPTPTAVPTNSPTATGISTATNTATAAAPTNTAVPTATSTPTDVPTSTPTDTAVPTATNTPTSMPTETATPTTTATATDESTNTPTPTPSNNGAIMLPGRVEVENYRAGGEGVGYHDTTAGNNGGAYRAEDVDIEACSDGINCFDVGWTDAGEWLEYDVDVATDGSYIWQARAATKYSGKSLHLELDGQNVGTIIAPNTGNWQTWTTVQSAPFDLTAGTHTLRLVWDTTDVNVNYFDVMIAGGAEYTFTAVADAEVRENSPSSNYGTATYIDIDGSPATEGFVCFNVAGISGSIQQARLRMYVANNGTTNGPAVYQTDSTWTEAGITWGNRPARIGNASDNKGSLNTNTWVDYNVTPLVNGNGSACFVLVPDSSDGVFFSSREGSQPAQLVLTIGN